MSRRTATPDPNIARKRALAIAAGSVVALGTLGYVWVMRDPGRTRTPCSGATHLASPGYFSKDWCLQRQVSGTQLEQDGSESSYTGWGSVQCFPTEAEARAACAGRP